jgi:hypothetical protein
MNLVVVGNHPGICATTGKRIRALPGVNPFITAPLLYGAEVIVPPSSMGLQARGGMQWGEVGQDFDCTVWGDSRSN